MAISVSVGGKRYASISEAARSHGLSPGLVNARRNTGWSLEEALELVPVREIRERTNRMGRPIIVNGKKYDKIKDAAEEYGFTGRFIANRLNVGLTPEQALELEPFPDWFVAGKSQKKIRDAHRKKIEEIKNGTRKCSTCKAVKTLDCFHGSHKNDNISSRCRDCISASFLLYRYGISVEDFEELRKKQKGACAICEAHLNIKENSTIRGKGVAVDHCHESGKVRGLLCAKCNQGLGMFKDNPELLNKASEYLLQSGGS